jgi:hypothetical protein
MPTSGAGIPHPAPVRALPARPALHPPTPAPRGRGVRRALALIAGVTLAAGLAGCGTTGDSAAASSGASGAARRLDRAAAAMQQVASYRFHAAVGTGTSQVVLDGEFQAPDRVHETVTLVGRTPVEVVFAGNRAFVKDAAGTWHDTSAAASSPSTDVRTAFGALTKAAAVSRHGTTYTFRVPAHAALALVGTTATGAIPAVATLAGNEIAALTYRPSIAGHRVDVGITYTDVNDAPAVSVPAAG